jgi:predicted  nucleic acid-binding Zn-ribbon protein
LGCESKKSYDIYNDKAVEDMTTQITELNEDLTKLSEEISKIEKVLDDPDLDTQLRANIRKEVLEGNKHIKDIEQWIAYLKIRRKKRYNSLVDRKGQDNLAEEAEAEVKAYFLEKELKPIPKKWRERFRTAIEL